MKSSKFTGRSYSTAKGSVHEECYAAWSLQNAEKCFFCGGPIAEMPGKYSGSFYEIAQKGKLHAECGEAWQKS